MAEQMRPSSKQNAPDPASQYDRSKPDKEAGMGRLDNNKAIPARSRDKMDQAVKNKQDPTRQINAEDVVTYSMKDEEPRGEDAVPTDIHDPKKQRHPRTGGKGGTPDAGENPRRG